MNERKLSLYVYHCPNRNCKQWSKKVALAMSPSDNRLATGGFVKCRKCAEVMVYDGEQLNLFEHKKAETG